MSVDLILTILYVVLQDGPGIYGGVKAAIDAIERLRGIHGYNTTLGQVDSALREHGVNVEAIRETYGYRPEGQGTSLP